MKITHLLNYICIVGMTIWTCSSKGAEVGLAWDANPETNIAGYEVLVGRSAGTWERTLPTGNVTTYRITGLDSASLYYFSVRAVNTTGLKSADATPITHTTDADIPLLDRTGWEVAGFSSQELQAENGAAIHAIDTAGNTTFWNSKWSEIGPHFIVIRLVRPALVSSMEYTPHQTPGDADGYIQAWSLQASMDGAVWDDWASGRWSNTQTSKVESLPLRTVRYVKLWGAERYASVSDLILRGNYEPTPPVTLTSGMESSTDLNQWNPLYSTTGPALDKQFFRLFFHRSDGQRVNATYTVELKP